MHHDNARAHFHCVYNECLGELTRMNKGCGVVRTCTAIVRC